MGWWGLNGKMCLASWFMESVLFWMSKIKQHQHNNWVVSLGQSKYLIFFIVRKGIITSPVLQTIIWSSTFPFLPPSPFSLTKVRLCWLSLLSVCSLLFPSFPPAHPTFWSHGCHLYRHFIAHVPGILTSSSALLLSCLHAEAAHIL